MLYVTRETSSIIDLNARTTKLDLHTGDKHQICCRHHFTIDVRSFVYKLCIYYLYKIESNNIYENKLKLRETNPFAN